MATTILKGKVLSVGPVQQVGENKTDLQYLVLFVPGYHDGFEKKGRDNHFLVQIMGKKVTELNLKDDMVNKIITANCYIDSQYLEAKEEGKNPIYAVNITLASYVVNNN